MKKVMISVLSVFIPVIMILGVIHIRNLDKQGIGVMPISIGLCLIMFILFIAALFLLKKAR